MASKTRTPGPHTFSATASMRSSHGQAHHILRLPRITSISRHHLCSPAPLCFAINGNNYTDIHSYAVPPCTRGLAHTWGRGGCLHTGKSSKRSESLLHDRSSQKPQNRSALLYCSVYSRPPSFFPTLWPCVCWSIVVATTAFHPRPIFPPSYVPSALVTTTWLTDDVPSLLNRPWGRATPPPESPLNDTFGLILVLPLRPPRQAAFRSYWYPQPNWLPVNPLSCGLRPCSCDHLVIPSPHFPCSA